MGKHLIRTSISLLLISFIVEATDSSGNETTLDDIRQPRVSGRIVKLYSGPRPEPFYCSHEGFQPDPVDCAVFYRCVKGYKNKYTVFRFQCGPGTVYDPDTEVCNFPGNTKRYECGGKISPSTEKHYENEIEKLQPEVPSPINSKPVYGDPSYSTPNTWATSKPQFTQESSVGHSWVTTPVDMPPKPKPAKITSKQEGDECTKDGFMGDSENCRKFYRCVGNQRGGYIRYEFSCSESTIWDDDAQSCNHPWAVQRRRCGRGTENTDSNALSNGGISNNYTPNTVQQQLQISYGDKISQTQTQISHGDVVQNQTQINYGGQDSNKQNSHGKQNQTQISHGSAISQTQTQISHAQNGVQTQLQIDHSKDSSQSQSQVYETTSRRTTLSEATEQDTNYGFQPSETQKPVDKENESSECFESGFMGDKNDCKKFYRCVDNGRGGYTKYEFTCGEGTVWDANIEACNHRWAVKECGGKAPDSSSQSPSNPTFSTTTTTTQNYQESSDNEDEDPGYGQTNPPYSTTKSTTQQPKPTASGSNNAEGSLCETSGFMGDKNDCNKFYRCVDNGNGGYIKYEFKCGEGTVWDADIEACNHAWAVKKCGTSDSSGNANSESTSNTAITTVSLTEVTTLPASQSTNYNPQSDSSSMSNLTDPPETSDNECKSSGFMGDKNDCKKFYRCVDSGNGNYIRYEFSCGEGTVWDPKIEACNHVWAVEKCGGENTNGVSTESSSSQKPIMNDQENSSSSPNDNENEQPAQSSTTVHSTEPIKTTKQPSSGQECSQEGFMGDSEDCKKFYRCVDNGRGGFIRYEFSCGEETVWDSEINGCNHANDVKTPCSSSSSQNENTSGSSTESFTDSNQSSQSSVLTEPTEKPFTSNPSTGKHCKQEGFFGDENDCKRFYRCVDNGKGGFIKYEFSCGEGTVWDSEINNCNHPPPDGKCKNTSTQISSTTQKTEENDEPQIESDNDYSTSSTDHSQTSSTSPKPQQSSNECKTEGFFGNSNNCKKFYRCVDNGKGGFTKYDFDCGDGTIWDQEIQACNHESSNTKCALNGQTTSKPQLVTSEESITSSTTSGGQSIEGKPETAPSGPSNKCNSDGFFANPDDCKKFFRCVNNGKGGYTRYDFSCGEGTVWVQEIQACDHDTGETSCSTQSTSPSTDEHEQQTSTPLSNSSTTPSQEPEKEDDEAQSETNNETPPSSDSDQCTSEGFYPNKNDCKRFYRCVDNGKGGFTKYDFACGEGTAWDSDIQTCNHIGEVKNCQSSSQDNNQPQNVEEDEPSQTSSTTSSSRPTSDSSEPVSGDKCEQEGYFGNSQDCTKFYRCVDNGKGGLTKYDFTCGEGTIWDQDVTTCNHPQDVEHPSCQQSSNNESTSSSSTSTTTESSPSSSSSGSSSSQTESSGNSSDCSGTTKKPGNKDVNCTKEGYYANPNDCKKFYRCVDWDGDGTKFSVFHFECGEGTIWDPALDTCNHEDSVYPPRDCSGGGQSQSENVENGTTTTEESTTTQQSTTNELTTSESTTIQQTTQQSTTDQQTTIQQSTEHMTTEQTTTHQSTEQTTTEETTEKQTTEQSTTHSNTEQTTEQHTTEQTTEQHTTEHTTEQHTTEHTTEQHTTEQTTTEESTKQTTEHTTDETTRETTTHQTTDHTTDETTQQTTTQQTTEEQTTHQQTTEQGTTQESSTTEQTTEHTTQQQSSEESTTQETETTHSTTEDDKENTTQEPTEEMTTQETTTENSTHETEDSESTESTTSATDNSTTETEAESTTESGEQTTESSSSSEKECPETEDDQNVFVCPTSFRRHPKYCNMFYQCTEDDDTHDLQIATFRCPNNTIYDESKVQCVEEKKADKKCNGEIAQKRRFKRGDALQKEPIVVTKERLKCPAAGHFPFEKEECSSAFLKCQKTKFGKIRGFVFQCPPNHVYWSVSRRCESKSYMKGCKQSYNNWDGRWEIPIERRNVAP